MCRATLGKHTAGRADDECAEEHAGKAENLELRVSADKEYEKAEQRYRNERGASVSEHLRGCRDAAGEPKHQEERIHRHCGDQAGDDAGARGFPSGCASAFGSGDPTHRDDSFFAQRRGTSIARYRAEQCQRPYSRRE